MKELTVIATTIKQYKKNPQMKLTKKDHLELLKTAKHQYYNEGTSELTDAEYDDLEDRYVELYGELPAIGAPVKLDKVKLPYTMGSQNKIKDASVLERWIENHICGSYVVTDKLDGISFLYANTDGTPNLYTRGDGVYGKNISLFIPHLDLPPIKKGTAIRGELIMSNARFEKLWSDQFANARNMVAGITNRKDIHKALADVKAIAYELIGKPLPLEDQLIKLKSLGFSVVPYKVFSDIDFNVLVRYLNIRRSKSKYAIDGLVIQTNERNKRNTSGNPDYAFAFKQGSEEDIVTVNVVSVTWNASRLGKLKPIVNIEPTKLQGVTISNLTAHNAKYIVDNKIGPKAKIKITRSGEVIPYIVEVVKGTKPQLPTVDYVWEGVDLVTTEVHEETQIKQIEHFFSTLGIEGLRYNSIVKLLNAGAEDLMDILEYVEEDWQEILGRNGLKIYKQLEDLYAYDQNLASLLTASGLFNSLSYKSFAKLVKEVPDIMVIKKQDAIDRISQISGWGSSMLNEFIKVFPKFKKWLKLTELTYYVPEPKKAKGSKLASLSILFTGFRDQDLADTIEEQGGKLASGVSKNLDILLIKPGTQNNKTAKAQDLGIRVMTAEELRKTYKLK